MLFTIIIPVYNRAQLVRNTLDTVLAQTHRPLQLVLVDNCSTDDTMQVLQQFAMQHDASDFQIVVAQEQHHTAGAARNTGFELAKGEWIVFFDSDDEMAPRLVEAYAREVARLDGAVDLLSARSMLVFPDGSRREAPFFTSDLMAVNILHSQLATQRYAVRRDFFANTQGWNADLPGWNDWELGMRMLIGKARVNFVNDEPMVIVYHNGKDSITGTEFHTRAGQWEQVIDLVEQQVRQSALSHTEQVRYCRLLDYRRLTLAAQYEREGCKQLSLPLAGQAIENLRNSYSNSIKWRWWVSPVTRWLYRRIVHSKRGSARIAQRLF